MTKATATRQLRELIGDVLKANGIDNIKAEMDVASAVQRFLAEVKTGRDPVELRDEIGKELWKGITGIQPIEKMKQRIADALRINISENPTWGRVVLHCLRRDEQGEHIEQYAAACADNPFGMPKPFQIAQKPQLIVETWPLAFTHEAAPREGNEFYA